MIRLRHDEKPTDPELKYSMKLNYGDPESDVIWMTTSEEISKGDPIDQIQDKEFRQALKWKIREWSRKARSHQDDKKWWPVKLASVRFWLPEGKFVLLPQDLGLTENNFDSFLFEMIEEDICSDLKKMGAWSTFYTGMMD